MKHIDVTDKKLNDMLEPDKWYLLYHCDTKYMSNDHEMCKTIILFTPKSVGEVGGRDKNYYKEYTEQHPEVNCSLGRVSYYAMTYIEKEGDDVVLDTRHEDAIYVIIAHPNCVFFELSDDEVLKHVVAEAL